MQKIDVTEFVSGGKRRPRDTPGYQKPRGSSYNAFWGLWATEAAAALLRRVKDIFAGKQPPALQPPQTVSESGPATTAKKEQACSAFGDLPPVPGSTKITFRN